MAQPDNFLGLLRPTRTPKNPGHINFVSCHRLIENVSPIIRTDPNRFYTAINPLVLGIITLNLI